MSGEVIGVGYTPVRGPRGIQGEVGPGVAAGGATGDVLVKTSDDDYETGFVPLTSELVGADPAGTAADLVDIEAAARIAADALEVINRNIAIGVETTNRVADVDAEETARINADAAEVTARNLAIAAEATARNTAIGVETSARVAADAAEVTARNTAIGVETSARVAADAAEVTARDAAIAAQHVTDASQFLPLSLMLLPETYGAIGDGVELLDVAITGSTVTSASATFTSADIGKSITITGAGQAAAGVTNGIPYAASIAPFYSTITAFTDAHTVTVAATANQDVTGQYGAYGTDNANALRSMFLVSAVGGRAVWIPTKNYISAKPLDFLNRTTTFCTGQIIVIRDATTVGGALVVKHGDDNILWIGGIINCADLSNMNGVAVGFDPAATPVFTRNVTFRPTLVTRSRINPAAHAAYPFSGGGKGVTAQFHLEGFEFTGRVENCDIGITIESAQGNNQLTSNVRITAIVKDCPYAAGVFAGSLPSGVGSLDTWGDAESRFSQARVDLIVENCGTVAAVGAIRSQFWANYATNLELNAYVRNANASGTTLWKGNVGHSDIKIRADVDWLNDGYDVSAILGASNAGLSSSMATLKMDICVKNTASGALFRGGAGDVLPSPSSRMTLIADYDITPSPSPLVTGFSGSATNRYTFNNKRFGFVRIGSTLDSTSNQNPDPMRFDLAQVVFAKVARWNQSATVPSGVTLADGDVAGATGTVQATGWGFAGPGSYLYRLAQAMWGKIRTVSPPIDLTATATLAPNQCDALITNSGAAGLIVLTLPAPVANTRGMPWRFAVVNVNGIQVKAPAGTTITIPGVGTSSSGGTATCTTVGGNIELTQITSTAWYATAGVTSGWAVA